MALINLSIIVELFSEEINVFKKGENCLESGNVIDVQFDGTLKIIRGRVLASMKKKSYQVEINLTESGIERVQCDCARGQHQCHHICAILLYANKNFSKTDTVCQWKAPTLSTEITASVSELFPKAQYRATNRIVDEADKEFFFNELKALNRFSGFFWLLSPEQQVQKELKSFAKILELSKNESGEIMKNKVLENLKTSSAEIFKIAKITCGQNQNPMWHQMRLGRLTASNFGAVLDSCQRDRYPGSLYARLLRKNNLDGIKSIQWGLNHEATALDEYENIEGVKVTTTGLWLYRNEQDFRNNWQFIDLTEDFFKIKQKFSRWHHFKL
ncbi:hypothetical protein RN001_001716 [Aquatica leii]|uniref:SWIM-type domain-containing protein n=1 Tax=Aquatica leii TaxID=1421715 RepID=A0AAN7PC27_9COLE|nr:hypothetical protein RN001_001716 [Aquatica leii]